MAEENPDPVPLDPLEVTYENTWLDHFLFGIYFNLRFKFNWVFSAASALLISYFEWKVERDLSVVTIFCVLIFILMFLLSVLLSAIATVIVRESGIRAEHSIRISKEGIREISAHGHTHTDWQGVLRIVSWRSFIYVFVTTYMAHIIPERAFESKKEWKRFCVRAQNLKRWAARQEAENSEARETSGDE